MGRPKGSVAIGEVGRVVLKTVAIAGALAIILVAPNCAQLLKYALPRKSRKWYYINTVVQRCIDRGLLEKKEQKGIGAIVCLTQKGKTLLAHYEFGSMTISKPRKWDKKYRIIIFDIKEKRRTTRDALRVWLTRLGFVRLQQSVWVHPYECQEVITLLKAHFHIGKDILYITADSIEDDRWLKENFNLI